MTHSILVHPGHKTKKFLYKSIPSNVIQIIAAIERPPVIWLRLQICLKHRQAILIYQCPIPKVQCVVQCRSAGSLLGGVNFHQIVHLGVNNYHSAATKHYCRHRVSCRHHYVSRVTHTVYTSDQNYFFIATNIATSWWLFAIILILNWALGRAWWARLVAIIGILMDSFRRKKNRKRFFQTMSIFLTASNWWSCVFEHVKCINCI